jgi:hypothetical protein
MPPLKATRHPRSPDTAQGHQYIRKFLDHRLDENPEPFGHRSPDVPWTSSRASQCLQEGGRPSGRSVCRISGGNSGGRRQHQWPPQAMEVPTHAGLGDRSRRFRAAPGRLGNANFYSFSVFGPVVSRDRCSRGSTTRRGNRRHHWIVAGDAVLPVPPGQGAIWPQGA